MTKASHEHKKLYGFIITSIDDVSQYKILFNRISEDGYEIFLIPKGVHEKEIEVIVVHMLPTPIVTHRLGFLTNCIWGHFHHLSELKTLGSSGRGKVQLISPARPPRYAPRNIVQSERLTKDLGRSDYSPLLAQRLRTRAEEVGP